MRHLEQIRPALYEYGQDLATSDYWTSKRNDSSAAWKTDVQLELLACEKLEQDAYGLMHSLLYQQTKGVGVRACIDGYRSVQHDVCR